EHLRRRPVRQAWTGSPDRVPSTIPPVEVPKAVLDAARNGSAPDRSEGEVILTPPGSDGDTFGDSFGRESGSPGPAPSGT
ncbi:MAG: cell division protein FtsH, partial [Actinomycetota bacterium]|nr:cell division protein FtsH [Actinomycetota bacterium]